MEAKVKLIVIISPKVSGQIYTGQYTNDCPLKKKKRNGTSSTHYPASTDDAIQLNLRSKTRVVINSPRELHVNLLKTQI